MIKSNNYLVPLCSDFNNLKENIRKSLMSNIKPLEIMDKIALNLKNFGKKGLLKKINDILNNEELLITVANRSYLHGNGFYKIVLSEENDFVIRINIWLPGANAEENLHDHRWHLASAIINGTLESEIWEEAVSFTAQRYDEYIYIGKTKQKEAHMLLIGKTKVSLKEKTVYQAGECYTLPSSIMHRIVSSSKDLVCTLICHPASARTWGRVISFKPIKPNTIRISLNKDQMRNLFQQYISMCD